MPKRKSLHLFDQQRCCHHFSGLANHACGAGIMYESVRVEHATMKGKIASLPCFPDDPIALACASFRHSTPQEVREERRQVREALRKVNRGVSPCCNGALVPVGGGWRACVVCNERVVHGYRGHEERMTNDVDFSVPPHFVPRTTEGTT